MSFLQRTYSLLDGKKTRILYASITGLFASLFLLVFNPYDALNWSFESPLFFNLPLWTAGFIAIPVLLFSQFALRKALIVGPFKIKHHLLLAGIELIILGIIFFALFADRTSIKEDFWNELYITFFYTVLMASIVYVFGFLCLPYLQTPAPSTAANVVPDVSPDLINIKSEKGKVELVVKLDTLLYIKSDDNYVSVFHLMNGEQKKVLIRTSLKKIVQELPPNSLIRVHRSYMLNPDKIVRIDPAKDTFKISLYKVTDVQIPVSSTYKKNLLQFRPELSA
ncbi:MAG: LytR/AlgR family response regulator transcription factor [Bacteroidia bacterium]